MRGPARTRLRLASWKHFCRCRLRSVMGSYACTLIGILCVATHALTSSLLNQPNRLQSSRVGLVTLAFVPCFMRKPEELHAPTDRQWRYSRPRQRQQGISLRSISFAVAL